MLPNRGIAGCGTNLVRQSITAVGAALALAQLLRLDPDLGGAAGQSGDHLDLGGGDDAGLGSGGHRGRGRLAFLLGDVLAPAAGHGQREQGERGTSAEAGGVSSAG